ncbi:putative transcription factor C2H2 family [Helianthus annuus]|nr:putative transcription factor C2H2 family [Helianthus annuus]KAJ0775155.1 putative transcription factor C2H2 family [Helianthus annuus]
MPMPMAKKKTLAPSLFFFFIFFKSISGTDDCTPASCTPTGPQVRFPFRLRHRQPDRCGFPGFDLSCNKKNQTVLHLPSSRSFIVKSISYALQVINIDPDFCSPQGLTGLNLTDTPFDFSMVERYTFYNCSLQNIGFTFQSVPMLPFPCLGSANHSVFAVRTVWIPFGDIPASCEDITTISVPTRRFVDFRNELTLLWFAPYCRPCELDGRTCGLKGDGEETVCFGSSSHGIPRSAKYGLSIGIGVPALVCIIGLVCYACKARSYNHSQRHNIDLFSIAITPQPPSTTGLDGPTIESYPKTILGESCRLPKVDDGTCAICLSDYQPKEVVRSIPECNHYFHADCIDEWLKLNATCPVCRKSPESSSLVTPCSSMSSNSSQTTNEG